MSDPHADPTANNDTASERLPDQGIEPSEAKGNENGFSGSEGSAGDAGSAFSDGTVSRSEAEGPARAGDERQPGEAYVGPGASEIPPAEVTAQDPDVSEPAPGNDEPALEDVVPEGPEEPAQGLDESQGKAAPDDEPSNPYDAYAAFDPYADDPDDADDGSDVTDDEARAYRTASQYSRVNAARHYNDERKSVLLPVTVALIAGVVVLAGVLAFLFGTRPATKVALDDLGLTSGQSDEAEGDDEQASAEAEPVDISLTMVGDTLIQPTVLSAAQTSSGEYDFSDLFSSVDDDISDADVALIDQESSMAGESYGYASSLPYNAPDSLGTAEQEAGIDVVLKASNYVLDLGYSGLHAELQTWSEDEPSMQVLGVADPEGSAGTDRVNNVYLYEKDGFKVAILNYTYGTDTVVSSSTDSSYVATLSEDKIKADVEAARAAGADMIVACPHWGVEYATQLSNEQTTYGQLFADEGVDVVLGDHPHVVQPVAVLTGSDGHSCLCFYSLGNFVSGTKSSSALIGSLAKVTLHKDADGTCSVSAASLVPVVTHRANSSSTNAGTAGFGVYRLSAYTDQLARQGWDTYLTPDYVRSYLDSVLGLTYDEDTGEYQVDLSAGE